MSELELRGISLAELPAITELLAEVAEADRSGEQVGVDDLAEELGHPDLDPARDALLALRDGLPIGVARLTPRSDGQDGRTQVWLDVAVHPDHRGEGVGVMLGSWVRDRALDWVAERNLAASADLVAAALSSNPGMQQLWEDLGFRVHRWTFSMRLDLCDPMPPVPPLPEGLALAPWSSFEPALLLAVHNEAFADHPGFLPWTLADWTPLVTESRALRPHLSRVAVDGDQVAGYLQMSEYSREAGRVRVAYVAEVGTRARWRGRGLAGALLLDALWAARTEGFDEAALDVDTEHPTGALGVYERAGFTIERRATSFIMPAG